MRLYHSGAALLLALATVPVAAQGISGTIRGVVVDARTGVPLEDVRVQVRVVYDLSDRQQLQASVVAGRSHYVDPEQDSPNSVEDGFHRAGLVTLAWHLRALFPIVPSAGLLIEF